MDSCYTIKLVKPIIIMNGVESCLLYCHLCPVFLNILVMLNVTLSDNAENKFVYQSSEKVQFSCDVTTNQPLTALSIAIEGNQIRSNSSDLSIMKPDLATPATMYPILLHIKRIGGTIDRVL